MNSDKLHDAIGEIKDEYIEDAEKAHPHKTNRKMAGMAAAFVAVAAAAVMILINVQGNKNIAANVDVSYVLACANYPAPAKKISSDDPVNGASSGNYEKLNAEWKAFYDKQRREGSSITKQLNDFYSGIIAETNGKAKGNNLIVSPANIYMALAMLSEITDGESRAELLRVLKADSIDKVRDIASRLWMSNYVDNGELVTIMANSIWTQEGMSVSKETVDKLVSEYYADVYSGNFTDTNYTASLKDWLNAKTCGQLKAAVDKLDISPETVLVLASTLYFRGKWNLECMFDKNRNEEGTFFGSKGETTVTYMKKHALSSYYYFEHFSAISLRFSGDDVMWLIRPDEGYAPEDIAADEELKILLSNNYYMHEGHNTFSEIDMWIPKFDISSDIDLADTLKEMGVTKIFDSQKADFSPLFTGEDKVNVSSIKHSSRVCIDEEGCEATSFITEILCGAGMPNGTVDFKLDHPFLFAITSYTGGVLFTGTVNNISNLPIGE